MRNKYYFIFILLIPNMSCKEKGGKNEQLESKSYFYTIKYKDTNRIDYSRRVYVYSGDTIKVNVSRCDADGEEMDILGEEGFFLKSHNKLFALTGKKSNPIKGNLVFDTSSKDSCSEYLHPLYRQVKNCFKGFTKEKNYIFTSSQQAIDGFDWDIVLDSNYSLIEKVSISPFESLKSEKRIVESEVPEMVLKKLVVSN